MSFERDTRVESLGGGRFVAEVRDGWDIAGNANGGYLLAIAARAMLELSGRSDPISVTAHYLRPGRPGPVSIEGRAIKEGKRFATVGATMRSGDQPLLEVLGTFGALAAEPAPPERIDGAPPALPPPEQCGRRAEELHAEGSSFMHRVDLRMHPDDDGFRTGRPSGEPQMRGWLRLADDEPIDPLALLLCADALPPTIFNAALPVGWAPTLELTVHLRARPTPGWLRAAFRTRFVTGGFMDEDGELWDASGRLVAQSRQLALLPRGE